MKSAECQCPRGRDKCHHIACILVWTEKNVSRTGVECKWAKPRHSAEEHSATASKSSVMFPADSKAGAGREVDDADRDFLFTQLTALNRFTGFWCVLSPEQSLQSHLHTFDAVVRLPEFLSAADKVAFVVHHLKASTDDTSKIKELTVGQRENPVWQQYRKMRLTASNFGVILHAVQQNRYPESLFKRLMGQYDASSSAAVQWGITHEATALAAYEQRTQCKVAGVGLVLSESGLLGASPDGMVSEKKARKLNVRGHYVARTRPSLTQQCISTTFTWMLQTRAI